MIVALLPAKPLSLAKTRLGSLLSDSNRAAIAAAMFEDVLGALVSVPSVDAVLTVTADHALMERARAAGARIVDEGAPRGLNGAVHLGTEVALGLGAATLLVVLSDVPLVTVADVAELAERVPRRGALLVPSKEGTGTNAIVRRPPGVFATRFGGRSLERHVAEAERSGIPCEILRNARLAFDVDTPEDLRTLASERGAPTTRREMQRIGLVPAELVVPS